MKLSVLFENAPGENKSLEYGHGLSLLIEFDDRKILLTLPLVLLFYGMRREWESTFLILMP